MRLHRGRGHRGTAWYLDLVLTFSIPHSLEHVVAKPEGARKLRRGEWSTRYRAATDTLRRLVVQVEEIEMPPHLRRAATAALKQWRKRLQHSSSKDL